MVAEPLEWRKYDDAQLPRVLEAALEAFAKHGYHGTSIRELASTAGLSVPGLYHHYPSKQDILVALLEDVMRDLVQRTAAALEEAGASPAARFDAWVECLLRFHMFRTKHAFVTSSELRSLEGANRDRIVALRDELQAMLDSAVEDGAADGTFATPYPKAASRGVTVLCIGVSSWYRPDGPLSPEELVHRHLVLARGVVNATE
ncbi:TetR/AcrR family transcriptional regulator [Nocardioides zeae]|nr:TetR/AcrR family transcriptional regulator [Nocardioides zeae]